MEVRERSRLVPLLVYVGGLVLMFLGERVFTTINAARMTLSLGGFGLSLAYLVLRLKGLGSETGERKAIEKMLAIFAFFLRSDSPAVAIIAAAGALPDIQQLVAPGAGADIHCLVESQP